MSSTSNRFGHRVAHRVNTARRGGKGAEAECGLQVRRKADGAKNLVKEWLLKWKDNPLVEADPAHSNIQGAPRAGSKF